MSAGRTAAVALRLGLSTFAVVGASAFAWDQGLTLEYMGYGGIGLFVYTTVAAALNLPLFKWERDVHVVGPLDPLGNARAQAAQMTQLLALLFWPGKFLGRSVVDAFKLLDG